MPVLQQKRDRDGAAAVAEMQALRRRLLHLLRLHRVGAPAAGVNPFIFRSPSAACSGRPPCARWGWERRPSSGSLPPRARPPFMPAEVYHDSIAACDTTATGCTQPWIKKPDCQAYRVLLFCLLGDSTSRIGRTGTRARPCPGTTSSTNSLSERGVSLVAGGRAFQPLVRSRTTPGVLPKNEPRCVQWYYKG